MKIQWNKLKPKKNCDNCNVWGDYVCFDCETIFIKENYSNCFYNDDCEWEFKEAR